jgi:hypothetical protein
MISYLPNCRLSALPNTMPIAPLGALPLPLNSGNVTNTCLHGACFWEGALLENGCCKRHIEDYSFELKDMFTGLGRPAEDVGFAYGMGKLNYIFKELGMP